MRSRRQFLSALFTLGAAAAALTVGSRLWGEEKPNHPPLKDTLKFELRAKRASEVAFIDHVVLLVDNHVLPRELVMGTFNWARSRNVHYPYPYFEFAMRAQAKKLGVLL